MKLFYFKWPLALFLLGFLIQSTGALFKIRHWPMADEMITGGYAFCAIAIVVAIIKIVLMKKPGK
jgi:hypothetical protein